MDCYELDRGPIYGHELLSILAEKGGSAHIDDLRGASVAAVGPEAVFANCSGQYFTFEGVLEFLESRGKLSRHGDLVSLGHVPACSGH
ncbi:MAG: DUF2492 family protein [Acidobacteria bacterium]|nr:DUF2492 family protein [Acidobacteriota bacterium]